MEEVQQRLFDTLLTSERLPFPRLLRYQAELAEHVVRHASERFPFYTERLGPVLRDGVFHPEHWAEVPILTRAELQAALPGILLTDLSDNLGWVTETSTSGSTGMPLQLRWTWLAHMATQGMLERLYRWYGFDPNGRLAHIRARRSSAKPGDDSAPASAPDAAPDAPPPNLAWSERGPDGISHFLDIATPIDRQIEWLQGVRPHYLSSNPTNLDALAAAMGDAGRALGLRAIITVGEILTPETRRRIGDGFGADVIDTYGCQELGKIALECPDSGLLHVCAENMIVEVLDDADRPVRPGETGRVVLTGFYNLATPFIRYAIGDYAETAAAPCSCGRTLPALKRVLGRQRNMFVFADGTQVWPRSALIAGLADALPLKQFQMIQTAHDRIELRYVPADPGLRPDPALITARLRASLHPSVHVTLTAVPEIARGPSGKFEDFISLLARAPGATPG